MPKRVTRKDMVKASFLYQEIFEEGLEKGREQGQLEVLRGLILKFHQKRFDAAAAELSQQLESVVSFERLADLVHKAAISEDLETFGSLLK